MQLVTLKMSKKMHTGGKSAPLINDAGKPGQQHTEKSLSLYTKLNSKRIKDLNVRPDTLKLLDIKQGACFNLQAKERNKINNRQMGLMKLTGCTAKETEAIENRRESLWLFITEGQCLEYTKRFRKTKY